MLRGGDTKNLLVEWIQMGKNVADSEYLHRMPV